MKLPANCECCTFTKKKMISIYNIQNFTKKILSQLQKLGILFFRGTQLNTKPANLIATNFDLPIILTFNGATGNLIPEGSKNFFKYFLHKLIYEPRKIQITPKPPNTLQYNQIPVHYPLNHRSNYELIKPQKSCVLPILTQVSYKKIVEEIFKGKSLIFTQKFHTSYNTDKRANVKGMVKGGGK
eukprot:TRINITY_DN2368_c0_g1_i10.p2 TRINITY_DN2368_c0_g1~~TRINITY_DN2368_c0_g1_i10.p2  ORF type:complete len:184 (-),score=7.89 TRINITY_DN2368_c0_g1_i10:466-1017(-)